MSFQSSLFLAQIFSCWFMTGVIWLVQVLVYPNFGQVGAPEFRKYHLFHLNRITWVVAPVMALELLSGLGLLVMDFSFYLLFNFATILLLWAITFFINVPSHDRLSHSTDSLSRARLPKLNWPRTIIWSLRSIFWIGSIVSLNLVGGLS